MCLYVGHVRFTYESRSPTKQSRGGSSRPSVENDDYDDFAHGRRAKNGDLLRSSVRYNKFTAVRRRRDLPSLNYAGHAIIATDDPRLIVNDADESKMLGKLSFITKFLHFR